VGSPVPVFSSPRWWRHAPQAHVTTVEQAGALAGLYLRAHNDFTVHVEGSQSRSLGFDDFHVGAARAALPGLDGWLDVARTFWLDDQRPAVMTLLLAVPARVGRALVARDYANVRIRHWYPDETWDEVRYVFESFLLSLSGAVNALARTLHVALDLRHGRESAGFRKREWRKKLLTRVPTTAGLHNLLADDSPILATFDLLGTLRNFIHGEVLSEELLRHGGRPQIRSYGAGLLMLQGKPAEALIDAASRVGGSAPWGIEQRTEGTVSVMPAYFQSTALRPVRTAIRAILATDVIARGGSAAPGGLPYPAPPEFTTALLLLAGLNDPQASRPAGFTGANKAACRTALKPCLMLSLSTTRGARTAGAGERDRPRLGGLRRVRQPMIGRAQHAVSPP
jgi:hypothetical protein